MPLYDYLYVDLPKVISLYSQITGGIAESREATKELARSVDNKRNLTSIPVAPYPMDSIKTIVKNVSCLRK